MEIVLTYVSNARSFDNLIDFKPSKNDSKCPFCRCFCLFQPGLVCVLYSTTTRCTMRYPKQARGECVNSALQQNHGNIATEGSPKPGLCPTLFEWLQGFFIVHSTIDSTAHFMPLSSLAHSICTTPMTGKSYNNLFKTILTKRYVFSCST